MASGEKTEKNPPRPGAKVVRRIAQVAFGSIAVLVVLDLLIARLHVLPQEFLWTMFDLGSEGNVPTWLASVLWLCAGAAAAGCYWADERLRAGKPANKVWLLMAAAFLYASIDEVATIHEEVGTFLKDEIAGSASAGLPGGSPHSPWILFYLPVVAAFLILVMSFLWRRLRASKASRLALVLAVECYLVAIGLDYYQGLYPQHHRALARTVGLKAVPFVEVTIVTEEALEMIATATLLVVLSSYVRRKMVEPETS